MTKILKKSLACLLAFVLCFTAIASCLAVSAEKPVTSIFYDVMELDNDNKEWQLCPGETVRGYVQVNGIKAGTTVGITLELPKHAEITKINPFGAATGSEISRYYDAEEGLLTIVFKAKTDGNWNHLIYFNVTDATPKGVFYYDCTVDAAIKYSDSDDDHYINTVQRHFEVKAHEAAEAVIENEVEATCGSAGSYDEVVYCKWGDNEEISRNTVTVDALGHAWDAGVANPEATCESEGTMLYTCTRCPETKTEAISAKGHTEVDVEAVAPTCTETGLTAGKKCSVCGAFTVPQEEVAALGHNYGKPVDNGNGTHTATCANDANHTITEDHDFTNGDCVCGAKKPAEGPFQDPNLKIQGASLGFGISSLEMTFRIKKSVIQLYDKVELVITPQKYDSSTYNLATPVEIPAELELNGSFYTYTYSDIQLYELGLNIDYQLKAYTGDQLVAVSAPEFTSPASYLKGRYTASIGDSTKDKFRTLIVDTLIVCDRSVTGILLDETFKDSALAQADSVIKDFDISEASGDLVSSELNSKEIYNTYDARFGNTNSAANKVAYSVTIGKTPYIGFRVKDTKNALDHTKISFKVSYIQNKGKDPSTGEMIEEPYSKTFTNENTTIVDGSMITFSFAEIGIQDGNKDVFIEFYYDGERVSDLTYSIESYLGSRLDSANIGALSTALLKLGRSFRDYAAG